VVQHLKLRLGDARNTVLLSGYQAAGTRGRALQEGATELTIEGRRVTVRAHVESIDGLSAHADQAELLRWARGFKKPPSMAYVVHGEPASAATLAQCLRDHLQWPVTVAVDQATVELLRP
jgi:metallo-beta-lactamase family protein